MRLVYLSNRLVEHEVWWRNITPPFERQLGSMPGCTVVAPPPLRRATLRGDRPAWLSAIRTVRQADAVFWIQGHLKPPLPLWGLAYAQPLAVRGTLVLDAWGQHLDNLAEVVRRLHIHRCWVLYTEALPYLREHYPSLGFRWMPMAANTDVFDDLGLERDIYAFWLGRRHDSLHEALGRYCERRGLTYRYSLSGTDPATTEELQNIAARSRYLVATPPDLNDPGRTGGYSPVTSRYLEAAAAGARPLGVAARREEMEYFFHGDEFVSSALDGSDLDEVLEAVDGDPGWEATRLALRDRVRREHSWHNRARQVYDELAGLVS
jgi:glycosyltransferase involved in cell wall biosynthesis